MKHHSYSIRKGIDDIIEYHGATYPKVSNRIFQVPDTDYVQMRYTDDEREFVFTIDGRSYMTMTDLRYFAKINGCFNCYEFLLSLSGKRISITSQGFHVISIEIL